jgi:predicted RecB family nuclease
MVSQVPTVRDLATVGLGQLMRGKRTVFPGIGPDTLEKYQRRAQLLVDPSGAPYLKEPIALPTAEREIFFDVESDPFSGICYLHGFLERLPNRTERYIGFFADAPTPEDEEEAFRKAWTYLQGARPRMIYYYSKYERTIWRTLREKYPTVCTENELSNSSATGR